MVQVKFSVEKNHTEFINQHKHYGFKDKSEVVRIALNRLKRELELDELEKSARLYAEVYETDSETRDLTEAAIVGWPE